VGRRGRGFEVQGGTDCLRSEPGAAGSNRPGRGRGRSDRRTAGKSGRRRPSPCTFRGAPARLTTTRPTRRSHSYFMTITSRRMRARFSVSCGLIIVLALLTDRRTAQGTTLVARAGPLLQAFGHVGAVILFGISGWALWHYFNHAGHTLVQSRYPLYFSIWLGFFLCTYLFMIAMRLLRKSPVWATNTPPIRTDELGLGEDGKGGVWRRIVYPWET